MNKFDEVHSKASKKSKTKKRNKLKEAEANQVQNYTQDGRMISFTRIRRKN